MMLNLFLSRFIMSNQAQNLAATAVKSLLSMNIRSVDDLYRDSEAYKTGYAIGYAAEKARMGAKN